MKRMHLSLDEYSLWQNGDPRQALKLPAAKQERSDREHQHQVALFEWAVKESKQIPELEMLFAIPNGGHRHVLTAMRLKDEGVKAGYPDVGLDVARAGYHGLRIEMKAGRNRLSSDQCWWFSRLIDQGYYCAVCYDWEEASKLIKCYLAGIPPAMKAI